MASEATTHEPPAVLSYRGTAPDPGGAAWVHNADGVRLVIPPPAPWRRMIGPAFRLAVMTPVLAAVVTLVISVIFQPPSTIDPMLLCVFPFSILIVLAAAALWIGALTRLIRIARRGRQPFVLRLLDKTFELTPAPDDPLEPGAWPISAVDDVRLEPVFWTLFTRLARLQIVFRDGDGLITYIPWPDASPMLPVETDLRRAFGVDLPVRTDVDNQAATEPCES